MTVEEAAAELETQITAIVEDLASGVVASERGVGALSAAQILLSWTPAGRIRSEAAFAMLSGTARAAPYLRPAPPRRRQDRQGNPPLRQALARAPYLPSPQPGLTNIERQ